MHARPDRRPTKKQKKRGRYDEGIICKVALAIVYELSETMQHRLRGVIEYKAMAATSSANSIRKTIKKYVNEREAAA